MVHLAFAALGVAGLCALAARRYGAVAAIVLGMLLAASPGLVSVGIEIRAYPLFFAVTVLQLWMLDGLFRHGLDRARLIAFAVTGLVATYVHFFGLISSSALFAGLVAARARSREDLLRIGAGWAVALLLSAGIVPFVGGARAISDNAAPQTATIDTLVAYLPRIYGHAAMLLYPALATILFVALAALLVVAVWRAIATLPARPLREPAGMEAALIVALLAGLVVTVAAGFVVHGFDPMKPSYSIWMVPVAALLAGAACSPGRRAARFGAACALAALLALLPITLAFARHSAWFVHGPERTIAQEVTPNAAETAIVYVGEGWGYGYFPLIYRYGRELAQYRLDASGALHRLTDANPDTPPLPLSALADRNRLLLVSIEPRSGDDLRALEDGTADAALFAPLEASLGGWHRTNSIVRPGLYWLRLARLERN